MQACDLTLHVQEKYWEYEYDEVITPNIYNFDLWVTSGHADHYKSNMFSIDIEKQVRQSLLQLCGIILGLIGNVI